MSLSLSTILAIILLAPTARASKIFVNPLGTGDFPTIQSAIDAAAVGDTIELEDGIYRGTGNRDIDYLGKSITVPARAGDPPTCNIDCEEAGRGFFFHSGETFGAGLRGVTITNGLAAGDDNLEKSGGGVHCRSSSSPTIADCILACNRAEYAGGGMALAHGASPVVTNCDFTENSAQYGGGLFAIDQCAPIFTNTLFRLQSATLYGGGVYCYTSYLTFNFCTLSQNDAYLGAAIDAHENSVANLANCTLSGNASGFGGVIRSFGASLDLTNTIIAFSAASSEAVYCVGSGGSVTLTCCNVYGNGGGDWVGCIETQLGERDNISSDPEFCSELPDTHMNWMLQSDSRCGPGQSVCGLIGAWGVGCGTSPVRHTSWGEIKTIYRP